jgi:hypothetical protein
MRLSADPGLPGRGPLPLAIVRSVFGMTDDVDQLLDEILVDAHGDAEQPRLRTPLVSSPVSPSRPGSSGHA